MEIPQRVGLSGVSTIDPATVGAEIGPLHCQIDCQGTDKGRPGNAEDAAMLPWVDSHYCGHGGVCL
jgi:hypothetical protein